MFHHRSGSWRACKAILIGVLALSRMALVSADGGMVAESSCLLKPPGNPQTLALPGNLLPRIHLLPDGHSALVATRNGWVLRLDLNQARISAQARVGAWIHATALSSAPANGVSVLAVLSVTPNTLVLLDDWLKPLQTLALADKTGRIASAALGVETAASRQSFVVALKEVPELWEISYNPRASEIGLGLVHDFQYREGHFVPGYLNPQRIVLDNPILDFALAGDGHEVLTRHAVPGTTAATVVRVTHLDLRRHAPSMPVPPWPVSPEPETLPWACTP